MGATQSKSDDKVSKTMDVMDYRYDVLYHSYFAKIPPVGEYADRRSSGHPTSKKITSQLNRLFNAMSLCKQREKALYYASEGVLASISASRWAFRGGLDRLGLMFDESFDGAFVRKIDEVEGMIGKERRSYLHKFKTHVFESLDAFTHARMFARQCGTFARFANPASGRPREIAMIEEASDIAAETLAPLLEALVEKDVWRIRDLCSDGSSVRELARIVVSRRLDERDEAVYRALVSESNRRLA